MGKIERMGQLLNEELTLFCCKSQSVYIKNKGCLFEIYE